MQKAKKEQQKLKQKEYVRTHLGPEEAAVDQIEEARRAEENKKMMRETLQNQMRVYYIQEKYETEQYLKKKELEEDIETLAKTAQVVRAENDLLKFKPRF